MINFKAHQLHMQLVTYKLKMSDLLVTLIQYGFVKLKIGLLTVRPKMQPRPKIIVGGRGNFFHFKAKVCIIELFNLNFTGAQFWRNSSQVLC